MGLEYHVFTSGFSPQYSGDFFYFIMLKTGMTICADFSRASSLTLKMPPFFNAARIEKSTNPVEAVVTND